jgi:hypothetical protein
MLRINMFFWLVAAVVLVLLLGFARVISTTYAWRLWPAIRRARREIEKAVRQRVPDAEVVSSQGTTAINPGYLHFAIKTKTDRERDLLRQDPNLHKEFRDALARVGYPTNTVPVVHFGIESQETVDRDYGGSWYQASQGP